MEGDFVNGGEELEDEEIKDAKDKGDPTLEIEENRKYSLQIERYRPLCTCEKSKDKTPYCRSVAVWLKAIYNRTKRTFDYKQAEKIYTMFLHFEASPDKAKSYQKSLDQINKDLDRTFPGKNYFKRATSGGTTGVTQLKNVLKATAGNNLEVGYVQGMNFIMGTLFFHSCEVVAFWLFDILMKEYNLRDIYSGALIGLQMHSKIIDKLVEAKYNAIWTKLV